MKSIKWITAVSRKFNAIVRVEPRWININRQRPPENKAVLLRRLSKTDEIIKAQFGTWDHTRDGEYTSWHWGQEFIAYRSVGQYWMEIPELP